MAVFSRVRVQEKTTVRDFTHGEFPGVCPKIVDLGLLEESIPGFIGNPLFLHLPAGRGFTVMDADLYIIKLCI